MSEPTNGVNGSGVGLSLRELVLEVRADVKALDDKIDKIDRTGSIGTREELQDHETRVRSLERWKYGIPVTAFIAVSNAAAIWFTGNSPL